MWEDIKRKLPPEIINALADKLAIFQCAVNQQRQDKNKTEHYKREAQRHFRRRSAIEGINSHLKYDFRMLRNYLKGIAGDTINLLMAAAAFNFRKWMRATALYFFSFIFISELWRKLSWKEDTPAVIFV